MHRKPHLRHSCLCDGVLVESSSLKYAAEAALGTTCWNLSELHDQTNEKQQIDSSFGRSQPLPVLAIRLFIFRVNTGCCRSLGRKATTVTHTNNIPDAGLDKAKLERTVHGI